MDLPAPARPAMALLLELAPGAPNSGSGGEETRWEEEKMLFNKATPPLSASYGGPGGASPEDAGELFSRWTGAA